MTILILHGIEGYAGIHWQQWLHDNLVKDGHKVLMPNLSDSNHPDRKTWLKTAQSLIGGANPSDLVIVGHSLGVPVALDFIEEASVKALISVSGFARDYGIELNSYFLREKAIDFKKINENLEQSFIIYSDDDPYVPQEELRFLAEGLKTEPIIISKGGHFNTDSEYTTFPLLLEIIRNKINNQ